MPELTDIEKLDALIATTRAKLEAYEALRGALSNDETAREIRQFFVGNGSLPAAVREIRRSGIMDKISDFFAKRENEWATIGEIVAGTRLHPTQIKQAMYKGHKERFDRNVQAGGGRIGSYRLKK